MAHDFPQNGRVPAGDGPWALAARSISRVGLKHQKTVGSPCGNTHERVSFYRKMQKRIVRSLNESKLFEITRQSMQKVVNPVKLFSVEELSDVVVFAGPNGVGKTRLVETILASFRTPSSYREKHRWLEEYPRTGENRYQAVLGTSGGGCFWHLPDGVRIVWDEIGQRSSTNFSRRFRRGVTRSRHDAQRPTHRSVVLCWKSSLSRRRPISSAIAKD